MSRSMSVRKWAAAVAFGAAMIGALRFTSAQATMPQTLVYAVYDNEAAAKQAFAAMKDWQKKGVFRVESYAVISKDQKGRVHVKSTQKHGARTGAIVGALIGVLGGPAGVAAGAAGGGGFGYLTGAAVGIPQAQIDEIKSALMPGSSAIVAVIDEKWVALLEEQLHEATAKQVLEYKLANPSSSGH